MLAGLALAGVLLAAYLLGSFPTGYLVARWLKGIDIRQHGSGGTGATNVLRSVGKSAALGVLVVDMLKGTAAVLLVTIAYPWILQTFPNTALSWNALPWLETLAGLLALLGHSRSVWLNFTGGKSAATGLGVLLALAWPVALGAVAVFAVMLGLFRMVSLGSISAVLATVLLMLLTGQPLAYFLLALAGGGFVILRHRTNIQRILAGNEPRLGRKSAES